VTVSNLSVLCLFVNKFQQHGVDSDGTDISTTRRYIYTFIENGYYRGFMETNYRSTSVDKNSSWKPNNCSAMQEFSAIWSPQIDVILHRSP
jgi:hypothetical protein